MFEICIILHEIYWITSKYYEIGPSSFTLVKPGTSEHVAVYIDIVI